jgi:hypothetical protein
VSKDLYKQFQEATKVKERTTPLVKVDMVRVGSPNQRPPVPVEVKKDA